MHLKKKGFYHMIIDFDYSSRKLKETLTQRFEKDLSNNPTVQKFIDFINTPAIRDGLCKLEINIIDIKQKNTYREIGYLITDENNNFGLRIPYKGTDITNMIVKCFLPDEDFTSVLELQDNSVPDDTHVPVYYYEGVYEGQKALYLIAKDYYDDMKARNKIITLFDLELDDPDEEHKYEIARYYDDINPELYSYYYEIKETVEAWQDTTIPDIYGSEEKFIHCATALSKPIDEIKALMREHGFELEPAPEELDKDRRLRIEIVDRFDNGTMFSASITNLDTNNPANPTCNDIQEHITKFQGREQYTSPYCLMRDLQTTKHLEINYNYNIDARPMDPDYELCANPHIIVEL